MRKIYSLLLVLVMLGSSLTVAAWSYDLSIGNDVLSGQYGYMLYKDYDFYNGNYNINDAFTRLNGERCYGDGCFTQATDKASFKLNGFDTYQVTEPVEMSNFFLQIGTSAINLRAGVGKDGLHNYGSGSRYIAIGDVKAGQIIVCQWGVSSSRASVVKPASAISGATACEFTDLTETIHAAQIEMAGTEDATSDPFSYWKAETDGYFVIEIQRDACIQGLQIWIDGAADEAVSAPTMNLKAVNLSERQIELVPGESTLGYECDTYYGIVDRGEKALFLIDTDEVASTEEVEIKDEEGNVIGTETRVTYKQVIDPEEIANGMCGENKYDDSYIVVSAEDDEDGDGYVTIAAATVSRDTYAFSDIVYMNVSVNEITLNTPTMTLTGLEGAKRQYQVGWANNTLCGEEFEILANIDGDERPVAVGEYVEAESEIGATVHVEGYNDGILEVSDVLEPGVEFFRKDAAKAEAGQHDWDFVNLTLRQKYLLKGIYSDPIGVVEEATGDTVDYAFDKFAAMVEDGTLLESAAVTRDTIYSGWTWDASRSRGTLAVVRDTTWTSDTEYTVATSYVEDKLGFYPECRGITFECAPNANNNSTILMYSNGDLGLYFMSRPTLTFSREAAALGEYVMVYQGAGGSNYTTSRWPALYEVPADGLLTFQLQSGGIHIFYIDVYTREDLPVDAIQGVASETPVHKTAIYNLAGQRVQKAQKGIYIINGKKLLVK